MNTEETVVESIAEIPVVEVITDVAQASEETPLEVTAEIAETIAKEFVATCYNQQGEFIKGFQNIGEAYAFAGENGYQVAVK